MLGDAQIPSGSAPTLWMLPPAPITKEQTKIYLDHSHWIELSRARLGISKSSESVELYALLKKLTAAGRVLVVLSSANYIESMQATGAVEQRTHLADVMSEISRFAVIRPREQLLKAEFLLALHKHLGRPTFPERIVPFGRGFNFAFDGSDVPQSLPLLDRIPSSLVLPGFDREHVAADIREMLEYTVLRGNFFAGSDAGKIFDLDPIRRSEDRQVKREQELQEMLRSDPKLKTKLDDIILARELVWTVGADIIPLLARAGTSLEAIMWRGKSWLSEFVTDIPSLAVTMAIRDQRLRGGSRSFTGNDARDITHLSVAVPYCDIVVTDKDARNAMKRADLGNRLKTTVLSDLRTLYEISRAM